jgi:hypothetical protein
MSPSGGLVPSPRTLEVESLDAFDRLVAAGAVAMHGWHAQSLDLRGRNTALESLDVEGAIFLGCAFDQGVEEGLRRRGALIFPRLQGVPFDPYRARLYTPQELYAGLETSPYEELPDALVYQWSISPGQRNRLDATPWTSSHTRTSTPAAPPWA